MSIAGRARTVAEAFDPRHNNIGFLRWFLALAVVFSHAGPLGGFYHRLSLGSQWSHEQSFGGVAVAGFFFLSGFLITRSRRGRTTTARYFWHRGLRIFPAFWAALILTAFVLGPLAWHHVNGTFHGYVSASSESPLTYFSNNVSLSLHQRAIAGLGATVPYSSGDWNGSAWTLLYEFKGYIVIGALGLFGILGYRRLAAVAFWLQLLMNTLLFLGVASNAPNIAHPLMDDFFQVMLLTPFLFGMMFALYADKIPIDDRLAMAAGAIAIYTYFLGSGWNVYGQFAFLYLLMWCAIRLPLQNWERHGDLSYGIYIYAFPIQQFFAYYGLQRSGWLVYHVVVVSCCNLAGFLSWHLLEKRALALKDWTPGWMAWCIARLHPFTDRAKRAMINPGYSSTHFAHLLRHEADPEAADLVTHSTEERVRAPRARLSLRRRWAPAAAVGFGATVVLVFGLLLPAVYRADYRPHAPAPLHSAMPPRRSAT